MKQRLFVLGASGNVGREFINEVITNDGSDKHRNPSEIVGIANSSNFDFDPSGINPTVLKSLTQSRASAKDVLSKGLPHNDLLDLLEIVQKEGMDGEIIFVDVSSQNTDEEKNGFLKFHKKVIQDSNNGISTANKNPLALASFKDFGILTQYHSRYNGNTTVMGGAGAVNHVIDRFEIRDPIRNIKGMLSGSCGLITSLKGDFSQRLIAAREAGALETKATDDLSGLDMARKFIILPRFAGFDVSMSDVVIKPLINNELIPDMNIDEKDIMKIEDDETLLDTIRTHVDKPFELLIKQKQEEGKILRYLGEFKIDESGTPQIIVGPQFVDINSDFGGLEGTVNLVEIESDILQAPMPHIIKSRGAGLDVTAAAVRVGVAKMLPVGLPRR